MPIRNRGRLFFEITLTVRGKRRKAHSMRCRTLFLLLIVLTLPLNAQDAAAPSTADPAPAAAATPAVAAKVKTNFVSRLAASAQDSSILLTWKDTPDYNDFTCEIYRFSEEITKENFAQAKRLASVKAGTERYLDTPTEAGEYYFVVLVKTSEGKLLEIFVPFRNTTTTGASFAPANQESVVVKNLSAKVQNQKIFLSYLIFPKNASVMVFRSARSIATNADLKDATALATISGTSTLFEDSPAAGLDFYYALIDARAYAEGKANLVSPENTTLLPIGIPLSVAAGERPGVLSVTPIVTEELPRPTLPEALRNVPLPRLSLLTDIESGKLLSQELENLPPRSEISPQTQKVFDGFMKTRIAQERALPAAVTMKNDLLAGAQGSQRALNSVLQESFLKSNWSKTIQDLLTLLRLNLEPQLRARIHFYLGQAYGFSEDYRRGFLEMLLAREAYFAETQPFLESFLSRMRD